MNSFESLPRHVQDIIKEKAKVSLQLYGDHKSAINSYENLLRNINANKIPKSINFKCGLIIPKSLQTNAADINLNNEEIREFKTHLETFQKGVTAQFERIAKRHAQAAQRKLGDFLLSVEKDIIEFHHRLLQKIDPVKATAFNAAMEQYPNQPHSNDPSVLEVLRFINHWVTFHDDQVRAKLVQEVQSDIRKEAKSNKKDAAEEIIMNDADNDLVKDLITKEVNKKIKPIQDSIKRLNVSKGERSSSPGKQKGSSKKPSVSFQEKPRDKPEAAKGEKQERGRTPQREERNRSPKHGKSSGRSKSPSKSQSPSPAVPKSSLKSMSNRHRGKSQSDSSDTRRKKN